jgi:hypothetical protein
VPVPDLPKSAADAAGRASINDLTQGTRIANDEGQTVLLRQYACKVNTALRAVLSGRETPLILAATEPLGSIFRAANTYPGLLAEGLSASPDRMSDGELAGAVRLVLDKHCASEILSAQDLYQKRVELLLVDIDEVVRGTLNETDGSVSLAPDGAAASCDMIDEIAGRSILAGARVLAVRRTDIPDGAALVAVLRYSV